MCWGSAKFPTPCSFCKILMFSLPNSPYLVCFASRAMGGGLQGRRRPSLQSSAVTCRDETTNLSQREPRDAIHWVAPFVFSARVLQDNSLNELETKIALRNESAARFFVSECFLVCYLAGMRGACSRKKVQAMQMDLTQPLRSMVGSVSR